MLTKRSDGGIRAQYWILDKEYLCLMLAGFDFIDDLGTTYEWSYITVLLCHLPRQSNSAD